MRARVLVLVCVRVPVCLCACVHREVRSVGLRTTAHGVVVGGTELNKESRQDVRSFRNTGGRGDVFRGRSRQHQGFSRSEMRSVYFSESSSRAEQVALGVP